MAYRVYAPAIEITKCTFRVFFDGQLQFLCPGFGLPPGLFVDGDGGYSVHGNDLALIISKLVRFN